MGEPTCRPLLPARRCARCWDGFSEARTLASRSKPGQSIGIVCKGLGQHLQRHVPVELGVSGSIHLTHAAFADLGGDGIRAERCAGTQWQRRSKSTDCAVMGAPSAFSPQCGTCPVKRVSPDRLAFLSRFVSM